MLVVALIAVAVAMVSLALRDSAANKLEEEGARLAALLEGARARARVSGLAVRWLPGAGTTPAGSDAQEAGFRFVGLPPEDKMPTRWLDPRTQAFVIGAPALQLGPEPIIGAQQVVLQLDERRLTLATDGLGPFVPVAAEAPPQP